METLKVSQSRIHLINDCLGKFNMKYVQPVSVSDVVWSTTVFGDAIHEAIDKFLIKYSSDAAMREEIRVAKEKKKLTAYIKNFPRFDIDHEQILDKIKKEYRDKNITVAFSRKFPEKDFLLKFAEWSVPVIKFVCTFFDLEKPFKNEQEFEVDVSELLELDFPAKMVGVYDHKRERDIVDFKTTTKPEKYFFVDWGNNVQSSMYAVAFKAEEGFWPEAFSYVVFNVHDSMIFVTRNSYSPAELDASRQFVRNQIIEVRNKMSQIDDHSLWSPSNDKCSWCEFCNVCPVAPSDAKKNRQQILKRARIA